MIRRLRESLGPMPNNEFQKVTLDLCIGNGVGVLTHTPTIDMKTRLTTSGRLARPQRFMKIELTMMKQSLTPVDIVTAIMAIGGCMPSTLRRLD